MSRSTRAARRRIPQLQLLALLLAATGHSAAAPPELAAEQVVTEVHDNTHVGTGAGRGIAQVFTLQDTGPVSHVVLPISCEPQSVLTVQIQGAANGSPDGTVYATQNVPGYVLDAVQYGNDIAAMRMIEFTRPVTLLPGQYAFVLQMRGKGTCGLWRARRGYPYPHFAWTRNGPAGRWHVQVDVAGHPQVLAFQVYQRPE